MFRVVKREIRIFVRKGPGYHYAYSRWRLNRWLGQKQIETTNLDDRGFFAQFDLEKLRLRTVKKAVVEGNYEDARTNIAVYFKTRTTPRFFFNHQDVGQSISLIDNNQRKASIRSADEICQNSFHFRGEDTVQFKDGIDWTYRPNGNIDWTWDLNRHAYFETLGRAYWYTGDERYAHKFRELLLDWLTNNPPDAIQPNWASPFEIAFRINTWIWAFYYFRSATVFDNATCQALLKGLLTHGYYLNANLEFHIQNNHLLLEAKALAMLGLLFPEFKCAEKWQRRGLKILYRQIKAQVCSDGVHGERATLYHQVIAGQLLELLVLLENNDVPIPPEIVKAFERMVEFELWLTKPDGFIPLLGDSALKDTYLRFLAVSGGPAFLGRNELKSVAPPLDEASIWLLGPKRVRQYLTSPTMDFCLNSRAFPEGGYFVMRQEQGPKTVYLAFDCGPFGYGRRPGHGHADALSFELYAHNQTFLVDPGIYSTYLGQDWRNFFRGSRAHNTVVVDNQDQSTLADIFQVHHPAQSTLHQWISSNHFDFVDGSHNGYKRLAEPIRHRRQIFFAKPEYWIVIDILTGRGQHCFDLFFHLLPGMETQLESETGLLRVGNGRDPGFVIAPLASGKLQANVITGATAPIQGWVSFFSGKKQPAPTLRYRREAAAPVQFCTVLYPYPTEGNTLLKVSPLNIEINDQPSVVESRLTSLQIETNTYIDYLIVGRTATKRYKIFADYETDAQLTYVRHKKENNKPTKIIIRGGNRFLFQGQSLLETHQVTKNFIFDRDK